MGMSDNQHEAGGVYLQERRHMENEGPAVAKREALEKSEQMRTYLDALWERLPRYAERAAAVPANETGSVEEAGRFGKFLWEARERAGITRDHMAAKLGIDINTVRLVELGLGDPEEVRGELVERYAAALGQPGLGDEFRRRFERQ
jgi:ribosome-binding protein aMBF1 (putative translation factor)